MLDLSEYGLGEVETNKATVQHRGIRWSIPVMIWVGGPWSPCQGNIRERKTLGSIQGHAKKRGTRPGIAPNKKNASGAKHRHMRQQTARTVANPGNMGIFRTNAPLAKLARTKPARNNWSNQISSHSRTNNRSKQKRTPTKRNQQR